MRSRGVGAHGGPRSGEEPGRAGAAPAPLSPIPAEDAQRCPDSSAPCRPPPGSSVGPLREHKGGRRQLWPSSASPVHGDCGAGRVRRVEADLLRLRERTQAGQDGPGCPGSRQGGCSERCDSPHTSPHHLQALPAAAEQQPKEEAMVWSCAPGVLFVPVLGWEQQWLCYIGGVLYTYWVPGRRIISRPRSCKFCT